MCRRAIRFRKERTPLAEKLAFIVTRYHRLLFIITLVLTLIAACMFPFVTINKDMTKYIPAQMQSKQGLDLMAEAFGESSQFRMMFEDVPADKKVQLGDDLKNLACVYSVTYDDSEKYNRENYTLYEVAVDGGTYSEEALEAYDLLLEFADQSGYTCYFDSEVIDAAMPNLFTIICFAMVILIGILLVMARSWFEPVLLLITLGIAVVLNMGTNLMFESVSDTTFSIAGIFQLVLSLDYSVMLMSRYRLEREKCDDLYESMYRALSHTMGSISSSALTTVVGMVCLVLMSFTIGRDMGLVLAKGVVFSLLCVFTVMPTLVLKFDGLLQRTTKRSIHPKMRFMTVVSHRARMVVLVAFCLIFAGGFALRNLAEASFTLPSMNPDHEKVESVFPNGSQVLLIYDDRDYETMLVNEALIGEMDGVLSINSYSSTMGQKYTAKKMAYKMGIDESFMNLLYYYKQHGAGTSTMTLNEFVSYLNSGSIDASLAGNAGSYDTSQLSTLLAITNREAILRQRTASEMADYLGALANQGGFGSMSISEADMQALYLVYYMTGDTAPTVQVPSLTIREMVDFVLDYVATDETLSRFISAEQIAQLRQIRAFLEAAGNIGTQMDSVLQRIAQRYLPQSGQEFLNALRTNASLPFDQMARLLEMDSTFTYSIGLLYAYANGGAQTWTVNAYDLVGYLCGNSASYLLGSYLDAGTKTQLQAMYTIMDSAVSNTSYTPAEMAVALKSLAATTGMSGTDGLNEQSLTLLYLYHDAQLYADPTYEMSLEEFMDFMVDDVISSPLFGSYITDEMADQIKDGQKQIKDSKSRLINAPYYRTIIYSEYGGESQEMRDFITDIRALLEPTMVGDYYLVGQGPMAMDMSEGFMDELNFITIVTTIAIALIVVLTFRNPLIAIILVGMIQSSFFWTMAINGLMGSPMYYVAVIIVQAILMGATIDYAILYTSNYRVNRMFMGMREAIKTSYYASVPTMLTSGTILVVVTFVLGVAMGGSAVAKICLTISEGSFIALLMVLLVLPGLLAALDRWVTPKGRLPRESSAGRE